jgi:capsular polysaccharide biosynthesis protein
VQIVDRASLPKNPSSPNVRNEIIKGFLIGAVLSMAAIVAIHLLDRRIHNAEDINANYTIPVLGILPKITADQIEVKGVQNNETV